MNLIFKSESALFYETGFRCDNALLLSLGREAFFITDPRYSVEAREQVRGAEVLEARDIFAKARELLRRHKIAKLFYDPKEFTCAEMAALGKGVKTYFAKRPNLSWERRLIKRPEEIEAIQQAATLNAQAFQSFAEALAQAQDRPEWELAFMAEEALRYGGRYQLAFEPIVAIGANAAKPHASPSDRPLKPGDLLLFDGGLKYQGYCSDRTRTALFDGGITFSKEQRFKDPKIQRAYDLVRKAQEEAIRRARSGMRARDLDRIARSIIDESEFAGTFVHSLGHGVGLDIHEMPFINGRNDQIIEDGMVFTIEPGIYVPGAFGIRIEDMVVMESGRARVL
ncbi:MAG: X-Pro aminopeptidase [Nitratiruptor sp.]|nr:X-Pro aminopeptidase [Nitratiruptor sp.]NPA82877.1 M24 family metallopeptidase [Campylobacterota bacterium]